MAAFRFPVFFSHALAALLVAAPAWAQDEDEDVTLEEEGQEDEFGEEEEEGVDEAGGEEGAEEGAEADEGGEEVADAGVSSVAEEPGVTYYFVGARYRGVIVPKFMQNLFADGGRTVYVNGFGPEFAIREDGAEYNLSAWLAFYGMEETGFKGKDDPVEAWEIIKSELKILYLTADFLWSAEIQPEFAFNYGLGAGFGFVFGDLHRAQSFPPGGDVTSDKNTWGKCQGLGNPDARFCDNENDHFGDFAEPSWFNGGSKPNLFPWLMAQFGFRIKPHPNFVGRIDFGFGTSGFFFGLGADYGLL